MGTTDPDGPLLQGAPPRVPWRFFISAPVLQLPRVLCRLLPIFPELPKNDNAGDVRGSHPTTRSAFCGASPGMRPPGAGAAGKRTGGGGAALDADAAAPGESSASCAITCSHVSVWISELPTATFFNCGTTDPDGPLLQGALHGCLGDFLFPHQSFNCLEFFAGFSPFALSCQRTITLEMIADRVNHRIRLLLNQPLRAAAWCCSRR